MMNLLAICLVLTSLFAAEVWCPVPAAREQNLKEDVIVREGHRAIVVETFDENGHHNTKVSISPEIKPESVSNCEWHTPGELICDALGKCTHKIAGAIGKAKHNIAGTAHEAKETAQEAIYLKKKIAYAGKDKVEDVAEKAKEAATEKAHKAKEVVEDNYEQAKVSAAHQLHNVKKGVKESIDKAKGVAQEAVDIGGTIRMDVAGNTSEQAEHLKEKLGSPEALNALMGVVNLLGFATGYGMCVWVTFISSSVLGGVLPRHQFGLVQSKIYPVYFRALGASIGLALLGHLLRQRNLLMMMNKAEIFQAVILAASIMGVLVNAIYLEPLATKLMFERMRIEKEEGIGEGEQTQTREAAPAAARAEASMADPVVSEEEEEVVRARIAGLNGRVKKLNSYSSLLNMVTLMALTCHLVYLGHCL